MTEESGNKPKRKIKRKPGVTAPAKMYFNSDTQAAIVEYQESDDRKHREKVYVARISPAFVALVDNLVNIHRFVAVNETVDELKHDCVHFLFETIHKFDATRGTNAFSYFNVVAKNWLIIHTKQKNLKAKRLVSINDEDQLSNYEDKVAEDSIGVYHEAENKPKEGEISKRVLAMLSELQMETTNQNESACIDSVARMFEMADNIDILNKNAVLLYLRELSGLSSKQLTAAMQALKKRYLSRRPSIVED